MQKPVTAAGAPVSADIRPVKGDESLPYLLLPGVPGVVAEGGQEPLLLPLPQHGTTVGGVEQPAPGGRDHLHGPAQAQPYLRGPG